MWIQEAKALQGHLNGEALKRDSRAEEHFVEQEYIISSAATI